MPQPDIAPIAISCGDPAGIGPEIAVKAWESVGRDTSLVWIGDPEHLPAGTSYTIISDTAEAKDATGLPVYPLSSGAAVSPGTLSAQAAPTVIKAIETGVAFCQSGACSAICTAPIHKQALIDGAGFAFPGHTEFLAHLAGVDRVVMMLASPMLRVVPVTIHVPLSEVSKHLTADLLRKTIRITHQGLRDDFGLAEPRIAVTGLNPHAGEGGKMGTEDDALVAPVIAEMRDAGMLITGPHSADTLFHAEARKGYDAAIAMYHDQALIPIKTLDFAGGVNVTLGLPFVRTSPDHGTALDIAGTGKADPSSMIAAINLAADMARARRA